MVLLPVCSRRSSLMLRSFVFLCFCCILLSVVNAAGAADSKLQIEFFEKRIRPLLVEHCQDCHGGDTAEGKLRLDQKSGWQRGGNAGPAIVPGDPTSSLLVRAITYQDPHLQMPPPDAGGMLQEEQISDIMRWIRDGAVDPRNDEKVVSDIEVAARDHWAFQPLNPPRLKGTSGNPIDLLTERRLGKTGFVPTDRADVSTLVRRAFYDLHGLPPTAAEMQIEYNEFPQLVRRLLASPRYGERWGRHWLDVARYSDAKDGVLMYGDARIRPFAYTYRDYVIRAFNDDKPLTDFIREQLAADQLGLPENSPALAGMGLLTLGRMFDNNRHDVIDDQIDVVTRGFLGLTVSCARCHDHKFDPVPTADYYSLYGVFASCVEPYQRPRIEDVPDAGQAFEDEYAAKLKEVYARQLSHYEETLSKAREKTPEYLVQVATTEPDVAETAIFFLSLIPGQLRPQITARWRRLIAQRAFPEDPIFGPWSDLMRNPTLRPEEWRARGIDERVIQGLINAAPDSSEKVARVYGQIIRDAWQAEQRLRTEIAQLDAESATVDGGAISLADIVGGGNGLGTGTRGHGIHAATGGVTDEQTGFVDVRTFDSLIPVPEYRLVDGVFVPRGISPIVSSTGLRISGLSPSAGQTWDHFRYGPTSGFTVNTIDGIDYSAPPHHMLSMHANKGITFDLNVFRQEYKFETGRFRAILGHGGAKDQSHIDFFVFLDGTLASEQRQFAAQAPGTSVDIPLPENSRFLTLVVLQGSDGISHDQAFWGDPRVVPDRSRKTPGRRQQRLADLQRRRNSLQTQLQKVQQQNNPLRDLLTSRESPVWFPKRDIYNYLSRQQKDAYRGLVGQLDAIGVKHKTAAARAMVLTDSEQLYEPVIFQRGNPGAPGNRVPRRFLQALSPKERSSFTSGSGRLDLANAIATSDNPLTARVWVNRIWMHHFGEPLVENAGDFGLRTPPPVHADLLDFLADYLIRHGWKTKPLHELIMTSKAWQRSSLLSDTPVTQRQIERDPENRYLWHANRRRLDFEQMRDSILFIAGQLDSEMYGRPPLITDPDNHRRTVYAFVERQNIPSIVQTFDFANADTSTARRVTTTVPQQALFAMNSDFMAQAAQALADRIQAEDRVGQLYELVYGRAADESERALAAEFLKNNSLNQLAQVLLMSNELMFVD